jgi:hypothetical protein
MRRFVAICAVLASALLATAAEAALVTYNSGTTDFNNTARTGWLKSIGIDAPQYRVDFETGFADGQNVSNRVGLFPGRLLIRDTSSRNEAIVRSGPGSVALSNPVGKSALTWDGSLFDYLELDFSGAPVDYVGWQDIDTTSNNSRISIYFANGTYQNFYPDATYETGDSAEFLGFYRNDLPQITKVRLNLSGDLYGIDNIEFGNLPDVTSLPGDYNADGAVDAADYIQWRKSAPKGNETSRADSDDGYDVWRTYFGEPANDVPVAKFASLSLMSSGASVPEPSTAILLVVTLLGPGFCLQRRSRSSR